MTAREIALQCGFNGGNDLEDAFRKEFGISPLKYKKELHNKKKQ